MDDFEPINDRLRAANDSWHQRLKASGHGHLRGGDCQGSSPRVSHPSWGPDLTSSVHTNNHHHHPSSLPTIAHQPIIIYSCYKKRDHYDHRHLPNSSSSSISRSHSSSILMRRPSSIFFLILIALLHQGQLSTCVGDPSRGSSSTIFTQFERSPSSSSSIVNDFPPSSSSARSSRDLTQNESTATTLLPTTTTTQPHGQNSPNLATEEVSDPTPID